MNTKLLRITLLVVASTLLLAGPALAYLDPATMTLIFNSIAAGIFACLYVIKLNWQRLMAFFKGKRGETKSAPEGEPIEK